MTSYTYGRCLLLIFRMGRLVGGCSGWVEGGGATPFPCLLEMPYDRVPLPGNEMAPPSGYSPQPLPAAAFYSSPGALFITHPSLPVAAPDVIASGVFLVSVVARVTGIDSQDYCPCSVIAKGARPALKIPQGSPRRLSSGITPVDSNKCRPWTALGGSLTAVHG